MVSGFLSVAFTIRIHLSLSMPWNSHVIIDDEGETRALYNKLHLFDLEIPGKVRLMESEFSKSGTKMVPPVDTPIGRLGLSICYDLRFPELALWNRYKGAEILSYPSSFTLNTGLAHWEPLLPNSGHRNTVLCDRCCSDGKA
ncbi:hydrolase, carbon-nitrogen family [Ostertagia ostertagi]